MIKGENNPYDATFLGYGLVNIFEMDFRFLRDGLEETVVEVIMKATLRDGICNPSVSSAIAVMISPDQIDGNALVARGMVAAGMPMAALNADVRRMWVANGKHRLEAIRRLRIRVGEEVEKMSRIVDRCHAIEEESDDSAARRERAINARNKWLDFEDQMRL
jgi:hypothetical protein